MYQNEDLMTVLRLLCILSHTQVSLPTLVQLLLLRLSTRTTGDEPDRYALLTKPLNGLSMVCK